MKAPICGVCLKSGILCRTCLEKFESGRVTETDIKVARALLRLSGSIKSLRDIDMQRAFESDSMLAIVCARGDAARIIGKSGLTVKKLEKELGKPVRIVESGGDMRAFITDLLHPVPVHGINVVYRPQGEVLRVLTGKGPGPRVPVDDMRSIIMRMFRKDVEFSVFRSA
ncbi:MAG: transcription elongation factor NusA [Candidatus Aenigmarchaeota archaeon]|nr:transcription elongation factor NusA [Candidatus Aenigmarchaeota archaeon]